MTHKEIAEYLFDMADENKITHSIIIEGVYEEEDKKPAMDFVRRLMGSVDNLDVIIPMHEKPHLISVDEVRVQIVDNALMKPYGNPYKIYLIEGNLLNEQGQNSLLKTLEEPPSYAIFFIFVRSAAALLSTVRSRCLLLSLTHEGTGSTYTEAQLRAADIGRRAFFALPSDGAGFTKELQTLVKNEAVTYPEIFDMLRKVIADELSIRESGRAKYIPTERDAHISKVSKKALIGAVSAINEAERQIGMSVNAELAIREMFLKMRAG